MSISIGVATALLGEFHDLTLQTSSSDWKIFTKILIFHPIRNGGSHLAAVTPTNYVLELSPEADGAKPRKERPQASSGGGGGNLKRKRRSAKQQAALALASASAAATSQGTLNL